MYESQFEEYLKNKISALDEMSAGYAHYHRWDMFLPKNYEKIRENMDEQSIAPNVVDIGCGAGFGSQFFSDGLYVGVDKEYPHIGFGAGAAKLGKLFFNQGNKNVSYVIDAFPSGRISEILKKKTLISSMSLGAYGELENENWKNVFKAYCEGMANAENIFVCGPKPLTRFVSEFFGSGKQIGSHFECGGESATECPIVHVKP